MILFSHAWDQIAYFQNPFFQGDFFHPGLLDLSQNLFDELSNFTNEHETYELPLINKLIDELNKLTEYQNEEWSKFRILHALELSGCAIPLDNMDSNVILSTIIGSWAAPRPPPVLSA